MENTFDIPRGTTQFGNEPREAEDPLCAEIVWRYRELLAMLESQGLGDPDPIVLATFTIEPGESILVCSSPHPITINRSPADPSWLPALWIDSLDTRPWWAVRLY